MAKEPFRRRLKPENLKNLREAQRKKVHRPAKQKRVGGKPMVERVSGERAADSKEG